MDFEEYYRKNVERRRNRSQPSIRQPQSAQPGPASRQRRQRRQRHPLSTSQADSSEHPRRHSLSSDSSAPEFLLRTEDILSATAPVGSHSANDAEVDRLAHMVEKYRILLAKTAKDKRQMAGLCTKLTHQLDELRTELQEVKSSYEDRVADEKRLWEAEEESRRSSWLESKTRVLKDQTIRAFQPELQKLLVRHKADKKQLIAQFEDGLRIQQTKLQDQHAVIVRQLQADFEKERDEIRESEKESYSEELGRFKADFQKLRDDLEDNYDQRVLQASEKARNEERLRIDQRLRQKDQERVEAVKRAEERHQLARQEESKRFEERLQLEREKMALEKDKLRVGFDERLREREKGLRGELNSQLDQQVDLIVKRIQDEFAAKKAELIEQKRLEVAEARLSVEQEWSKKVEAAQEKIAALEAQASARSRDKKTMAGRIALLQDQIESNLEGASRLDSERRRYSDELRVTRERLESEVERRKQLRERMTQLEIDQSTTKQRSEDEMVRMMSAAKKTIVMKDETIDNLMKKMKVLQRTIHSTNSMLRGTQDLLEPGDRT